MATRKVSPSQSTEKTSEPLTDIRHAHDVQELTSVGTNPSQSAVDFFGVDVPSGFPPKGQYTAKALGEEFGFDPSGIEKYYLPEALDLYGQYSQVLKSGTLFTQVFYDLMFLFRQRRMREKLVLNDKGQIIRHAGNGNIKGKPVLEPNQERMNKQQFRDWYWEQHPELIPLIPEDSAEVLDERPPSISTEVVVYETPVYEESVNVEIEGTLIATENYGETFNSFREGIIQQFRNEGKAIASEGIRAMQEEIAETTKDFFGAMKGAVGRTTKQP